MSGSGESGAEGTIAPAAVRTAALANEAAAAEGTIAPAAVRAAALANDSAATEGTIAPPAARAAARANEAARAEGTIAPPAVRAAALDADATTPPAEVSTLEPLATAPTMAPDEATAETMAPFDPNGATIGATAGTSAPVRLRSGVEADETLDAGIADMPELPTVDGASYAVGAEIARGGMGRILAARDRRLRRDVVIKIVRSDAMSGRFQREALITARLQHPSIVRVYDAGMLDGVEPFYAMERVRGESLDRRVAEAATPEARRALLPHVIAVADALAYAHSEGIIHRDLKPANVLVGKFGETVVIDWGLAKDLASSDPEVSAVRMPVIASEQTVEGSVMGTPAYMPPEQARGEPADERSDVYAIGAILYTVLCGKPPVTGAGALTDAAAGVITPLAEREPTVPPELVSITERAMAHDPGDRYPTAEGLASELRSYAAGQLVASHAYTLGALVRRWFARHRAVVFVAGAAVLALAVLSAIGVRQILQERDRARAAHEESDRKHDDMLLQLAGDDLAHDPSRAIAWLAHLTPARLDERRAHDIAARAAVAGLAFELAGPRDDVEHLVAAGRHIWSASDDGHIWRWHADEVRGTDLGAHASAIECLTISADGRWIASGGTDHAVRLWDATTNTGRALEGHRASVRSVAFSPDGTRLASSSEDNTLRLWDVATGEGREVIRDTHPLRGIAWSLDGARLWVGTGDGRVLQLDVAAGTHALHVRAHDEELRVLALSPDGRSLASGAEDGNVRLWAIDAPAPRTLGSHADVVRKVLWSPDGRYVVSAGGDKHVRVYDVASGKAHDLKGNTAGVKGLAISHDGKLVATAGIDEIVRVWPIRGGKPRTFLGHRAAVKDVVFTASSNGEGDAVISASEDDRMRVWPIAMPPPPPRGADLAAWITARTNVQVASP